MASIGRVSSVPLASWPQTDGFVPRPVSSEIEGQASIPLERLSLRTSDKQREDIKRKREEPEKVADEPPLKRAKVVSEDERLQSDEQKRSLTGSSTPSLFQILERDYRRLNHGDLSLSVDDSSVIEPEAKVDYPTMTHRKAPSSSDMTVKSHYCGRKVRFKGNQLIFWARDIMKRVIEVQEREKKIAEALSAHQVTIHSSDDWLVYEGMFAGIEHLLAKPSAPFFGIATIFMSSDVSTTVEFKHKINKTRKPDGHWTTEKTSLLYAHIHDKELINYLQQKFPKYRYPDNYGLSYRDIVDIIENIKMSSSRTDADLARRQLRLLSGKAEKPITSPDRFFTFFNAILFGSETSRNSLSFVTGLLVLNMIEKGKLTYVQGFQTPDPTSISEGKQILYAAYPMASPYAGSKSYMAYKRLMELTAEEQKTNQLSSKIGMKTSRKRPKWTQIQIKEAVLFKFWTKDWDHQPGGLNISVTTLGQDWPAEEHGHAINFARRFSESIIFLLHHYFPRVPKLLVYSPDEQYSLGWFKPSTKVWKESSDLKSTETDFNAMNWYLTPDEPLRVEKYSRNAREEIEWDIRAEIEKDEEGIDFMGLEEDGTPF